MAARKQSAKVRKSAKRVRAAKSAKSAQSAPGDARTIVYVHGVGNKPTEDVLRCQWDQALLGFGLGERSRMSYWCQGDRHGPPTTDTCKDSDAAALRPGRGGRMGARALQDEGSLQDWVHVIAQDDSAAETRVLERLAARIEPAPGSRARGRGASAKGLGDAFDAPDFLTRLVTRMFLVDVRDFFFDAVRRKRMQQSFRSRLETGGGPFVIVAHSQGSMVAYSVLRGIAASKLDVSLFLTIGSPLGLEEVRDQLTKQAGAGKRDRMPIPACVKRWVNVLDPKDVVAQDVVLGRFYKGSIGVQDIKLHNPSAPYDAHSATGYLSLAATRQRVRECVELERFQRVSQFTVASDVVADHERQPTGARRPLLIELTDPVWALDKRKSDDAEGKPVPARPPERLELGRMAKLLEDRIVLDVCKGVPRSDLRIQKLKRYLSVHLTREETELLANSDKLEQLGLTVPPFYRVWRNAKKRALLETSIHTVQASAAHLSYEALGQGIEWAVLDSGCTPHKHFDAHGNLVARWDCTLDTDEPVEDGERSGGETAECDDGYGHGTHVAGIIAGAYTETGRKSGTPRTVRGIAPRAKLHIYKVLDDEGEGDDAWIIKAINHVADVNEQAGRLRIAGVNLSLGGPYEQNVFACGFTPLCDELRRLWRQGVMVVLAAGNEGYVKLLSADGEIDANLPFTVGDPANLDVAIAVGSINKSAPHLYGVSSFSSRGPTVDGRAKPDCVAPGEQILSCRHDAPRGKTLVKDLYYKLDGTSMAAPHVSGILAAFLSRRREFIGEPDRQKQILLEHCTDLKRDRQLQGAGMPNLVKMLVAT